MSERDAVGEPGAGVHPEPLLLPRFAGEPVESIRARTDAMITVRFLKQRCGGSEAALYERMRQNDPAPPSTSTTGLWARGEVSSKKRATKTAYAYDLFGRSLVNYPPTGRTLQTIVRDVAPRPAKLARTRRRAVEHQALVVDEDDGETVRIEARLHLSPGEHFESAEVTGRRESVHDGRHRVVVTIIVTAVVVALVLVFVSLLRGRGELERRDQPMGPSSRSPSAGATASGVRQGGSAVSVQRSLTLDETNFCSWRLGAHAIPLVSVQPVTMRIDARCNTPADPDPGEDSGAAVYSEPSNDDAGLAVGRLGDGSAFEPQCWIRGDQVRDDSAPPNVSRIWILADSPAGYVPDVNVGGGYTAVELRGLGIAHCGA